MNKSLHCPYSILNADIICEHKIADLDEPVPATLHNHDGYEMVLFLNGDAKIIVESEEKKLEQGELVIIPPYSFHGIKVTDIDKYERIVLNFRTRILERLFGEEIDLTILTNTKKNKLNIFTLKENALSETKNLLCRLSEAIDSSSYGHNALAKAYLTEFLVMILNYADRSKAPAYKNNMPEAVKNTFKYIEDNIYNELTVEGIAKALHHNSAYLGRLFREATGSSLKYYINGKKIALAQQLLREGNGPCDVCFMLGFKNYSSFSRCFSKHITMSPKQYMTAMRPSGSF